VFAWLRRLLFGAAPTDVLVVVEPARARLVVGLGNPGTEYERTRHNLGFLCVEEVARRCDATWSDHTSSVASLIATGHADDLTLVLAKPQTYMNRSGAAVHALLERLGLSSAQTLVVYDDMDLPFGALRLRERGSPGTHNGMRSVVASVRSEDVPRLRVGISQAQPGSATNHVLSEFTTAEQDEVDELVRRAADAVMAWASHGAAVAMNRYNRT
jgi:PTH1 family peptidyl-tRNA hydrolase